MKIKDDVVSGIIQVIIPAVFFSILLCYPALAEPTPPFVPFPKLGIEIGQAAGVQDVAITLQIMALITILSLAPAIVMLLTSFTRIVIVLSFIRQAMGLQQIPPNQIVVSLALFLTFFTMSPVIDRINDESLQPYLAGKIGAMSAWEKAIVPVREFMLSQTRDKELSLMLSLAGTGRPENREQVPMKALMPAFVMSEMNIAFQMGLLIFLPFIVVDMIVASVLMAMGMMMLPPMLISLPFKILMFVMADGWELIISSVITSFR